MCILRMFLKFFDLKTSKKKTIDVLSKKKYVVSEIYLL